MVDGKTDLPGLDSFEDKLWIRNVGTALGVRSNRVTRHPIGTRHPTIMAAGVRPRLRSEPIRPDDSALDRFPGGVDHLHERDRMFRRGQENPRDHRNGQNDESPNNPSRVHSFYRR